MIRPVWLIPIFTTLIFSGCQNPPARLGTKGKNLQSPVEKDKGLPLIGPPNCMNTLLVNKRTSSEGTAMDCEEASPRELAMVNEGNLKRDQFLSQCYTINENSCWCDQLVRPNPESIERFRCTYGKKQVHQLIHPDESTWAYAFEAVKIVEELGEQGIRTKIIYNWWRPDSYNKNVGGSASRHPFGTSVDVRFETKPEQEKAFLELCAMRAAGRVRAIGYYASTALHFGIGDDRGNTWGKACP